MNVSDSLNAARLEARAGPVYAGPVYVDDTAGTAPMMPIRLAGVGVVDALSSSAAGAVRRGEGRTDGQRSCSEATKAKGLTDDEAEIGRLVTFGLPTDETIDGKLVRPDWPLTLEQATRFVGYRCKKARNYLDNLPEFSTYRRQLLEGRRNAEKPRNLQTLIAIRDDPGEGFAAYRTVRVKAVQAIEGRPDGASVTVNVNQQTNVAAITPGYVIRLPANTPLPSIEQRSSVTIEQEQEPLTIDQG
jgi:hypothetical protein